MVWTSAVALTSRPRTDSRSAVRTAPPFGVLIPRGFLCLQLATTFSKSRHRKYVGSDETLCNRPLQRRQHKVACQ